jgi:ribosomal protein S18 acetylase RimI-like enzyme
MKCRSAVEEDAATILRLWKEAAATESATDDLVSVTRAIRQCSCFGVAEIDGQIVGTAIGGFDGWRGNIYRVAVVPQHRRRGIARALLGWIEERFRELGVKRITALVEKEHAGAVAFWGSAGYSADARITRYVRNL